MRRILIFLTCCSCSPLGPKVNFHVAVLPFELDIVLQRFVTVGTFLSVIRWSIPLLRLLRTPTFALFASAHRTMTAELPGSARHSYGIFSTRIVSRCMFDKKGRNDAEEQSTFSLSAQNANTSSTNSISATLTARKYNLARFVKVCYRYLYTSVLSDARCLVARGRSRMHSKDLGRDEVVDHLRKLSAAQGISSNRLQRSAERRNFRSGS